MAFRIEMLPPPPGALAPIPPPPAHWLGASPGEALVLGAAAADDAAKGGEGLKTFLYVAGATLAFFVLKALLFPGDPDSRDVPRSEGDSISAPEGTSGLFGLGCGACGGATAEE